MLIQLQYTPSLTHLQINDIDNYLSTINVDKVDVVGFSFGGRLALALAAHLPHRVRRVSVTGVPYDRYS